MHQFERKPKRGKIKDMVFSFPSIIILGIFCLLTINSTWDVYKKSQDTKKNLVAVTKTYDELKARESELTGKIDSLKTPLGVEREIREKFGFVKEGEEVVVIVDAPQKEKENDIDITEEKSLWQKIKDWF